MKATTAAQKKPTATNVKTTVRAGRVIVAMDMDTARVLRLVLRYVGGIPSTNQPRGHMQALLYSLEREDVPRLFDEYGN